jgi:hypothetical protein
VFAEADVMRYEKSVMERIGTVMKNEMDNSLDN